MASFDYNGDEIAVVGMALRVPGAQDPWTFWDHLRAGRECFEALTDDELLASGVKRSVLENPRFVKIKAAMKGVSHFDARFFGLSPFDATLMDPQYRHFLELAWEALESAGQDPAVFKGAIGVYGGSGQNGYLIHHLLSQSRLIANPGHWYLRHVGNDKDFMTTRASYHLDLKGPSINVQTACSTSLVAIHLACSALIARECDLALAGGVTIEFPHGQGYLAQENGIEDPRGQCRSFDASSMGTVFGSGGGVVTLKRLEDATADGDHIFGLIKASAVSNDGRQKAGFTAPSVDGQVAAILEALDLGEINPESIGYVEGHGTGTPIGDPIEVQALTTAWRAFTQKRQFAALSSVKSNIGHLDTAAGVVSLIKAIGAVYQGIKYPTVHFKTPNPALDLDSSPFYVSSTATQWQETGPRRAAISSLGVGGTNAHVIVEQPPVAVVPTQNQAHPQSIQGQSLQGQPTAKYTLGFSANTPTAVQGYRQKLLDFLKQQKTEQASFAGFSVPGIAKSLQRRRTFDFRAVVSAASLDELMTALETGQGLAVSAHKACITVPKKIAFAFTGQGTQYFNMGRRLYADNPTYRKVFDQCADLLMPVFKQDIRALVFVDVPTPEQQAYLDRIDVTHPVLFSIAYALAHAWMAAGVKPDAMIGHSLGEYVAATLAGVFELKEVLQLVCERGRLMQSTPTGVMLSVMADEQDILPYLQAPEFSQTLSIAGVNVQGMCVVAGYPEPMAKLVAQLEAKEISCKALRIPRASHCVMMDSILDEYEQAVAACQLKPARLPIVSNINGQWLAPDASADPRYWRDHLRSAVRFADGADTMMQDPDGYLFIEIGPGSQLSRLLEAHPARQDRHAVIHSMPGPKDEVQSDVFFRLGLGRAWAVGALERLPLPDFAEPLMPLPTYAWDHEHLWVERDLKGTQVFADSLERQPFESWFSVPGWQRVLAHGPLVHLQDREQPLAVVLADHQSEALRQFVSRLSLHVKVVQVQRSDINMLHFKKLSAQGPALVHMNGLDEQAPVWLFEQLDELHGNLTQDLVAVVEWLEPKILPHLWAKAPSRLREYFHQVFFTAKALSAYEWQDLKYAAIGQGLLDVSGADIDDPMKIMVQGPIRALAAEQTNVNSVFVDFDALALKNERLFTGLVREVLGEKDQWDEISFRGSERFTRSFDQQVLSSATPTPATQVVEVASKMRTGGHYLIAGLGDLALVTAEFVVSQYQGVPVFLTRSGLAPEYEWEDIAESARIDLHAQRIRSLLTLKKRAPKLQVVCVDVTDTQQMQSALQGIQAQIGHIHGIFHTAGVLDDQLLSFKTLKAARKVLAPKVEGLQFYDILMAQQSVDFVLLFSSISSLVSLAGQADYAAANAFLASWARVQNQQFGRPVCAVHWGGWSEVGMAVQAARAQGMQTQVMPFAVNQLQACHLVPTAKGAQQQCYGLFQASHWVLNDHRTQKGLAIMPGTGVIDLLANTYFYLTGVKTFEIRQLSFQTPFAVANEQTVLAGVVVEPLQEKTHAFKLVSGRTVAELQSQTFDVHSEAEIVPLNDQLKPRLNLLELQSRFEQAQFKHEKYTQNKHQHMRFGPHWQCLKQGWFGVDEALLSLELSKALQADLARYPWHPGLLDLAIGGQNLMNFDPTQIFYVPLYYEKIQIFAELTDKCWSHVRLRSEVNAPDIAVFDVCIVDANGGFLIDIHGFHMKKTSPNALDVTPLRGVAPDLDLLAPVEDNKEPESLDEVDVLALSLAQGIRPHEGQKALAQILQFDPLPAQVVVASMGLSSLQGMNTPQEQATELAPRPASAGPYLEPQGPLEQLIATIWSQALGLQQVGRHDQYFELGGHSLLLIQIIARLKKKMNMQVPLARLFDVSTIAQWAAAIQEVTHSSHDEMLEQAIEADDDKTELQPGLEKARLNSSVQVLPVDRSLFRIDPLVHNEKSTTTKERV